MNTINFEQNKKIEKWYANIFRTKYDISLNRKNLYVDIRYGEIILKTNKNKLHCELFLHVANHFNLPQGIIKTNVQFFNQTIENLSLINSNLKVNSDFSFGWPDVSEIYIAKFTLDINEQITNQLFNNNIVLSFYLNTAQLDGINIENNTINNLISDLERLTLIFELNTPENKIINGDNGYSHTVNIINEIKVISNTFTKYGQFIKSYQYNKFEVLNIVLNNYQNSSSSFKDLLYINNNKLFQIQINIGQFQISYLDNGKLKNTNKININKNILSSEDVINISLDNVILVKNKNNEYELQQGKGGIYSATELTGKYTVDINIYLNNRIFSFQVTNTFSFNNLEKPEILYLYSDTDYALEENEQYFQIEEN